MIVGASAAPSPSPSGKLGVQATRNTWRDGSPVESGGENYPTDIYVVDVGRRHVRNVTRDERTEYCWSEGRRILFVAEGVRQRGLWVMQADGRHKRRLTQSHESDASWSPDGKRVVFVRELPRNRSDIFVINADGTGLHRLTRTEAAESEPAWSADGERIVFIRGVGPWGLPFAMRRDGTSVKRLASTGHDSSRGCPARRGFSAAVPV